MAKFLEYSIYKSYVFALDKDAHKLYKGQYLMKSKMRQELKINEDLCKIVGIHVADGHLSKRYTFMLKDEDYNNVKILSELIEKELGFLPKIKKINNENFYGIQFTNKRILSFIQKKFSLPLGPKTYFIRIPEIIKNNSLFEKAFIQGLMTFESSVNTNKSICLSIVSKNLRNDVVKILSKNKINFKISEQFKKGNRKKQYIIRTSENLNKDELIKWLDYYIEGSEKWYKILELSYGFFGKVKYIEDAEKSFELTYFKGRRINLKDLIRIFKDLNQTDINYIFKKLNIGNTTIIKYINLLENANIIKISKRNQDLFLDNLSSNIHLTIEDNLRKYIFNKLNKYFGIDAEVCRTLNVNDFVYARWKNGERGIDLNMTKRILKLVKIKTKKIKVKKIDRKVLTFNKNINEWEVPWRPWFKNIEIDNNNLGVKNWIIKS